jgi:hypothetical protein
MHAVIVSILSNPLWSIFTGIVGFAAGYYLNLRLAFRQRIWDRADRLREGFHEEIEVFSPDVDPRGRDYRGIVRTRLAAHRRDAEDFREACDFLTRFGFNRRWNPYERKAEEIVETEFPTAKQRGDLYVLMRRIASYTRKRI